MTWDGCPGGSIHKGQGGSTTKRETSKRPRIDSCLETGELPEEEKKAKEIILGKARYTLIDGILYHVGMDKITTDSVTNTR